MSSEKTIRVIINKGLAFSLVNGAYTPTEAAEELVAKAAKKNKSVVLLNTEHTSMYAVTTKIKKACQRK